MNRLEQLDFINKTMPSIIESFKELGIDEIITCEGDINYYLSDEGNKIQFFKETYDRNSFSHYVPYQFYSKDEELCGKVYEFTVILKDKIKKMLQDKSTMLYLISSKF